MNFFKKLIRYGLVVAFIAVTIFYLDKQSFDLNKLKSLDPGSISAIGALYCLTMVVSGIFTQEVLKVFDVSMSLRKFFHLIVVSSLFNLVLPARAGSGVKAVYLRNVCGLNYSLFLSNLAGTYVINFMVLAIIGMVAALFIFIQKNEFDLITLCFLCASFFGLILLIIIGPRIHFPKTNNRYLILVWKVLKGWIEVGKSPRRVLKLSLLTSLNTILNIAMMTICLSALNVSSPISETTYISIIGSFSSLLNITPGGLGVMEGMMIFVSRNLSIEIADLLVMSIIIRIITLLSTAIIFPLSLSSLYSGNFKSKFREALGNHPGESV